MACKIKSERRALLSAHARMRAAEMKVREEEVIHAVAEPDLDYPSGPRYRGRRVAVRGRVAVPYDPVSMIVLTVLWHGMTARILG